MKQSYPPVTTNSKDIKQISRRLINMAEKDQSIRAIFEKNKDRLIQEEMALIDKQNRDEFKSIFSEVGFINSKYGKEAQLSAFLIVQHMPRNEVEFMKSYLSLMKNDLEGIDPLHFAQLCDRVETWQEKPQIYGTQFAQVEGKENTFKLKDLIVPSEVDKRRKRIGLGTLKEYIEKTSRERQVVLVY